MTLILSIHQNKGLLIKKYYVAYAKTKEGKKNK